MDAETLLFGLVSAVVGVTGKHLFAWLKEQDIELKLHFRTKRKP